jgi:hypothetical protein
MFYIEDRRFNSSELGDKNSTINKVIINVVAGLIIVRGLSSLFRSSL